MRFIEPCKLSKIVLLKNTKKEPKKCQMAGSRNGLKKACALTVKRQLYRRFGRPALVSRKIGENVLSAA